jgi:glyoxylase-like metal-dependent hydrolase (beta-lactamase superfamily II)
VKARELASGLSLFATRTPTLAPATHTNSYALGGRDVVLVEPATPYDDEQRAWVDWVRGLASTGRRPVALFATHYHPDHVGGVDALSRELGVPLWAHAETAKRIGEDKVARRLEDGEELLLDGPVPQRWRVLVTPGHAWGHLCLHEAASGTLVVGDMVASEGTIVIMPGDGDMRLYLEQLARLRGLGARLALPAHGEPIDDPNALFDRYVAHRLAREARVLAAVVAAGAAGAEDHALVPHAYADTPVAAWPFALFSLRAHLAKLVEDGAVVVAHVAAGAAGERYAAARPHAPG